MYIAKVLIIFVFSCISVFLGFFSIKKVTSLPDPQFSLKGNYARLALYSSLSAIVDFLMLIFVIIFCGEGTFGTGIELVVALCVAGIYSPACIVCSHRLKKRMKNYGKINVRYINALNYTIFFKVLFSFFATIFFIECSNFIP